MKSRILIISSILTLLALVLIQGYLIYNTYELKQKTTTIDARNAIKEIYNSSAVDSISWLYRDFFLDKLESYKKEQLSTEELVSSLRNYCEGINPGFVRLFQQGLKEINSDLDIKFQRVVTSITITDSIGNIDTIYSQNTQEKLLLLGEDYPLENGMMINNSTWQKDHEIETADGNTELVDLGFKSSIYMNIENYHGILIRQMLSILVLSCGLFLFVVGLLYYSIQNLLKQKRIADIKTDFINNITHELKTPLSTLSIGTKTLKSDEARESQEIMIEAIDIIDRQNTRLQNLIDQVLHSSLGYKDIHLKISEFHGSSFINHLLDDYELTLQDSVKIERDIENAGILIHGDEFYIGTALLNLLNNAVKYGGTQLKVTYFIDTEEGVHTIKVEDDGIGIAPKYHKYIFGKFYRVSEKDTHNYKGLGLGLYYTHQIIQAHSGEISLQSEIGKGSVFLIKIPVRL